MSGGGYYPSPWPGEDGGPERLQIPRGEWALDVRPGARLSATRRRVWFGTMTVLRDPGEVYFLHHQMLRSRLFGRPTSAWVERIDPVTLLAQQEVVRVIKDLAAEHRTMLLVTHDMRLAADVSDHVIFLHRGRIEEEGPPAQLFGAPRSERLRQFLSASMAD